MTQSTPTRTRLIRTLMDRDAWFRIAVIVFVLLAIVGADKLGFIQGGQDTLCNARDFFIELSGETPPSTCP